MLRWCLPELSERWLHEIVDSRKPKRQFANIPVALRGALRQAFQIADRNSGAASQVDGPDTREARVSTGYQGATPGRHDDRSAWSIAGRGRLVPTIATLSPRASPSSASPSDNAVAHRAPLPGSGLPNAQILVPRRWATAQRLWVKKNVVERTLFQLSTNDDI